jgi:pyruvate kinase
MLYQAVRNSTLARYGILSTSESIASSAVKTAIDVNAKVLIVVSESGTTATQVAKFRPGVPIIVLTLTDRVARQCCGVLRGCSAQVLASMKDMDSAINTTIQDLVKGGKASAGDAVVVITGTIAQVGATNLMRVQYA